MTTNTGETQWIYLQGNYIVNGLILWTTNNAYSPIDAKTFIHGKLTSLSLPSTSYTKREQQIESLFGSEKFNIMKWFISLQDVFKRKCNTTTWLGIEGWTNSSIAKNIACGSNIDKHRSSSLIVVEKDYPTTLLK